MSERTKAHGVLGRLKHLAPTLKKGILRGLKLLRDQNRFGLQSVLVTIGVLWMLLRLRKDVHIQLLHLKILTELGIKRFERRKIPRVLKMISDQAFEHATYCIVLNLNGNLLDRLK
jgi:hypothetical protein